MMALIEEFGQYLRHERGQSEHTQKAYSTILNRFAYWTAEQQLSHWDAINLSHLLSYLSYRRASVEHFPTTLQKNEAAPGTNQPD